MTLLICAFFVYGVWIVIRMTTEFFDIDLDRFYEYRRSKVFSNGYIDRPKWQKFLLKPTIYCNVCMSSFWGSVYCFATDYDLDFYWVLHLVISAAIIHLLNQINKQ